MTTKQTKKLASEKKFSMNKETAHQKSALVHS